jgi:hypothetical protein
MRATCLGKLIRSDFTNQYYVVRRKVNFPTKKLSLASYEFIAIRSANSITVNVTPANTFVSLISFLNVTGQVVQPYKTSDKTYP